MRLLSAGMLQNPCQVYCRPSPRLLLAISHHTRTVFSSQSGSMMVARILLLVWPLA